MAEKNPGDTPHGNEPSVPDGPGMIGPKFEGSIVLPAGFDSGLVRSRASKVIESLGGRGEVEAYLAATDYLRDDAAETAAVTAAWINVIQEPPPEGVGDGEPSRRQPAGIPQARTTPASSVASPMALHDDRLGQLADQAKGLAVMARIIEVAAWVALAGAVILGFLVGLARDDAIYAATGDVVRHPLDGLQVFLYLGFGALLLMAVGRAALVIATYAQVRASEPDAH